ncbi:unnamed protein product [Urochloa humidicola]
MQVRRLVKCSICRVQIQLTRQSDILKKECANTTNIKTLGNFAACQGKYGTRVVGKGSAHVTNNTLHPTLGF